MVKIGPLRITTESERRAAAANGAVAEKEAPVVVANGNGSRGSDEKSKSNGLRSRFFSSQKKSADSVSTDGENGSSRPSFVDDPELFDRLSPQLQAQSKNQEHLWDYLSDLPVDDIGIPVYYSRLGRQHRELENRNLIYPLGKGVFVHIYPDADSVRDSYVPVEPATLKTLGPLMGEVDSRLLDYVDQLDPVETDSEQRTENLFKCLDDVCSGKGGPFQKGGMEVTEAELRGLKYLTARDKVGMGVMEPLISDPYIEDISCSGVGDMFVEHKIFGGLNSTISFDDNTELNRFVIKLSERIGRPVTMRQPIVDAVLPDGSRVNIVYGDDVSIRGSNFTIRKFNSVPMSIFDLVELGTLSYEMAAYLSITIGAGLNSFVCGETASGKTTLLNALSTFMVPTHKIVTIEDTAELQVPHPNWTREVIRGRAGEGSAVTMFDLLRAALRQRPNEIMIGEIRGEEGAIAFQAMQTGHTCHSTFHASSVEKLIQRLTGSPIDIPKVYVDNLNLAIVVGSVRLADGTPVRRVTSINEILGFDPESGAFNFVEVFRWNSSTDTFEFPGYMNSTMLEDVVAPKLGLSSQDSRQMYDRVEERADAFRKIQEQGTTNFYDLYKFLAQAHRQGFLG